MTFIPLLGYYLLRPKAENIHFLDMPFYETGRVKKKPLSERDIQLCEELIRRVLLFREGQPFDPILVAQSETNLRRLDFIKVASITAHEPHDGVVDIVRADVSWKGGVTPVMKTAHLAESFGVRCELHTTIYHPLEVVNLHCCAAISNCEFLELLYPISYMDFGMKRALEIDAHGYARLPEAPGIGVDWDWDFIDNCTIQRL